MTDKEWEKNLAKERLNQISKLAEWAKKNTNYNNITPLEAIKFFDSDKENLSKDLVHVDEIYSTMIDWAKLRFKIGNYTAAEYANVILLKKTINQDIEKLRQQIKTENTSFPNQTLSNSEKISIIQKTISAMLKQTSDHEIPKTKLVERLVHDKIFSEEDATKFMEQAIKLGAIVTKKAGYLTL